MKCTYGFNEETKSCTCPPGFYIGSLIIHFYYNNDINGYIKKKKKKKEQKKTKTFSTMTEFNY